MPNTLAHFGIQGGLTQLLVRRSDLKWILFGCIIPDCPWILRRVLLLVGSGIDRYDLQLYAVVQSSLAYCLVLAAAVALFAGDRRRVFLVLALNSLFHLLLDACQIKWGNGVLLLAPFSWHLLRFDWFWPNSLPTYLLTALGPVYLAWRWRESVRRRPDLRLPGPAPALAAIALLAVYLLTPPLFFPLSEAADNHSVATLRDAASRRGRTVELDRCPYRTVDGQPRLRTYAGEELDLVGLELDHRALISVRGRFVDPRTLRVLEVHEHSTWTRDAASYVGLGLLGLLWTLALRNRRPNTAT